MFVKPCAVIALIFLLLMGAPLAAQDVIFGLILCDPNTQGGPQVSAATFGEDGDPPTDEKIPDDLTGELCVNALTELRELGYAIFAPTVVRNLTFPGQGNRDRSAAPQGRPDALQWDLLLEEFFAQANCNVFNNQFESAAAADDFPDPDPMEDDSCTDYMAAFINRDGDIVARRAVPKEHNPPAGGEAGAPGSSTPFVEDVAVVYEAIWTTVPFTIDPEGAPPLPPPPPPPLPPGDGRP